MIGGEQKSWIGGPAGLALAIIVGAFVSFLLNQGSGVGQLAPPSETLDKARAADGSPRILVRSSTVTVVLFTDYRCPACRGSDEALLQAVEEDGHTDLVVRPLTLFGEESARAARAAIAADRQGRFLQMHRALMGAPRIDDEGLAHAARRAGIAPSRLETEMTSSADNIDQIIKRNRLAAFSLGFQGTPSYLIGRYRVTGALSARQIRRLLERARESDAVS